MLEADHEISKMDQRDFIFLIIWKISILSVSCGSALCFSMVGMIAGLLFKENSKQEEPYLGASRRPFSSADSQVPQRWSYKMLPDLIHHRSHSSCFTRCFWRATSWDLCLTLLGLSCAVCEQLPKLPLVVQQKCGQSQDTAIKVPVGTCCISSCGAGAFLTEHRGCCKREL